MKEHYKNQNNVVDSSGWLEYFSDAQNASFFAPAIETPSLLIVPSISILEVFRHLLLRCAEKDAFQAIECMLQGRVVDLDVETAVNAAKLGVLRNKSEVTLSVELPARTPKAHKLMQRTNI